MQTIYVIAKAALITPPYKEAIAIDLIIAYIKILRCSTVINLDILTNTLSFLAAPPSLGQNKFIKTQMSIYQNVLLS